MRSFAFALAAWLAGSLLVAQEQRLTIMAQDREVVALRLRACGGAPRAGGVGFVRLEGENRDTRPQRATAEIATAQLSDADVKLTHTFELQPGERAVAFLPLPRPLAHARVVLRVGSAEQAANLALGRGAGPVGLLLSDRPDAAAAAVAQLQGLDAAAPELVVCPLADAPEDWRLYTGFDAVVVDGRGRLGSGLQEALRRAAHVGGRIVVAGGDGLPAGALRQLAVAAGNGPLGHGLGSVIAVPPLDRASAPPPATSHAGEGPTPAAESLLLPQPIPGLGEAPVAVFLLVIVLFAVAAGPVNFLWLRRRKRPLLALVTVPLLGFGTTAVILTWGLVSDGFGVRGIVTSWTHLDQERHEAAVIAARTLFAGSAPGSLAMGPQALLLAPRATSRPQGAGDRWHVDAAGGSLDGGALPSRTPTPLVTLQQGPARQRLVARRQADGLVLAGDGGVDATGTVVLRDLDGAWYAGEAPQLRRVERGEAERMLGALRDRGAALVVEVAQPQRWRRRWQGTEVELEQREIGALATVMFAADALPPGGYVTTVHKAPWLEEHGLAVAYDAQLHFVRGRMQAEDFLP